MSQGLFANINPDTESGTDLATLLNDFKNSVASGHSGTSRPNNLQAGGGWIDLTDIASPTFAMRYKIYNGTTDTLIFTINVQTNVLTINGIPLGIFKADGTVAMTGNLDFNGNRGVRLGPAVDPGDAISKDFLAGAVQNGFSTSTTTTVNGYALDADYSGDGVAEIDWNTTARNRYTASFAVNSAGVLAYTDHGSTPGTGETSHITLVDATGAIIQSVALSLDFFTYMNVKEVVPGNDGYFYMVGEYQHSFTDSGGTGQPRNVLTPCVMRFSDTTGIVDTSFGPNGDGTNFWIDPQNDENGQGPFADFDLSYIKLRSGKIHAFARTSTMQTGPSSFSFFGFEKLTFNLSTATWTAQNLPMSGSDQYLDDGNGGNQNTDFNPIIFGMALNTDGSHYFASVRYDDGHIISVKDGNQLTNSITGFDLSLGVVMDDTLTIVYPKYSGTGYEGVWAEWDTATGAFITYSTPLPALANASGYAVSSIVKTGPQSWVAVSDGTDLMYQTISSYTRPTHTQGAALTVDSLNQSLSLPPSYSGGQFGQRSIKFVNSMIHRFGRLDSSGIPIYMAERFKVQNATTTTTINLLIGNFRKDGSVVATGDFDLGNNRLKNVGNALQTTDIPNYGQVVALIAQAQPTTANLTQVTGSKASPVVAADPTISLFFPVSKPFLVAFVRGNSAGSVYAMNAGVSQLPSGTDVGQRLTIIGTSDTDYLHLHDGDSLSLMSGNSDLYLYSNTRAEFMWDGTVWEQI